MLVVSEKKIKGNGEHALNELIKRERFTPWYRPRGGEWVALQHGTNKLAEFSKETLRITSTTSNKEFQELAARHLLFIGTPPIGIKPEFATRFQNNDNLQEKAMETIETLYHEGTPAVKKEIEFLAMFSFALKGAKQDDRSVEEWSKEMAEHDKSISEEAKEDSDFLIKPINLTKLIQSGE